MSEVLLVSLETNVTWTPSKFIRTQLETACLLWKENRGMLSNLTVLTFRHHTQTLLASREEASFRGGSMCKGWLATSAMVSQGLFLLTNTRCGNPAHGDISS